MTNRAKRPVFALLFALAALAPMSARAADVEGSKDVPALGRYSGSEITAYKFSQFDEALLLKAPWDGEERGGSPAWLTAEGAVTIVRYQPPPNRSSLEVYRNLSANLDKGGYQTLFECSDAKCVTGTADQSLFGIELGRRDFGLHGDVPTGTHARYRLAKLAKPEGDAYVSLLVGEAEGFGAGVWAEAVEPKAMETGKIVVIGAADLKKSLDSTGHIALYGVYFDTDKDVPKPESKPSLDEIGKLLAADPSLKLVIVGHTDSQGPFDHNIDLSKRRANAVAKVLAKDYGVAADRLLAFGAGMAAPAASNDSDEGRAKNRRVELVRR